MLSLSISHLQLNFDFTTHSITPILISRFILNLRQVGNANQSAPSRPSGIASIIFRISDSIVGNMDQPLDHGFGGDGVGEEAKHEEFELDNLQENAVTEVGDIMGVSREDSLAGSANA